MRGRTVPNAATLFEGVPRPLRRHRLMTAWMRLTGEDPVQPVRIRDESFGYADLRDGFLRLIVIEGNFERDFFRIADGFLHRGGVFLDVGANHGLLSFGLAGRHGASVAFHLFEPNPTLVESIHRTRQLYPAMRCTLTPSAVSDQVGVVSFRLERGETGASHIVSDGSGDPVAATTIDAYLTDAHVDDVTLLKLDVEGHELAALRGARRSLETRTIGAVYFEYFEKWLRRVQPPGELIQFLHATGYAVCFCREGDLGAHGGPSHTVRGGKPGHGVGLRPVEDHRLPEMTDLLAIPREDLIAL